jgi:hypothetical protein
MSERNYEDECGDYGDHSCGLAAGWGTDFESGKCRHHRGTSPDGSSHEGNDFAEGDGAPEGNTNAVDHELYAEENGYYQRRTDAAQEIIDAIYDDYYERFRERNGEEPNSGDKGMLFKVAVSIHKLMKADEWEGTRPQTLDSGHPLVDRSEKRTAEGQPYYEYVRTVTLRAEKQLQGFIRRWLKDNDLLGPADDGADVEVELTGKMWDNLTDYYE